MWRDHQKNTELIWFGHNIRKVNKTDWAQIINRESCFYLLYTTDNFQLWLNRSTHTLHQIIRPQSSAIMLNVSNVRKIAKYDVEKVVRKCLTLGESKCNLIFGWWWWWWWYMCVFSQAIQMSLYGAIWAGISPLKQKSFSILWNDGNCFRMQLNFSIRGSHQCVCI